MFKKIKVLILLVLVLLITSFAFYLVDNRKIKQNEKPIFSIKITSYDDGGSIKYLGLFYNVCQIKELGEEESLDRGYYIPLGLLQLIK